MNIFAHADAIQARIHRETMRFMSAKNEGERQFRFSQIEQAKKELASEYAFLGVTPSGIPDDISDDDLLEELKA